VPEVAGGTSKEGSRRADHREKKVKMDELMLKVKKQGAQGAILSASRLHGNDHPKRFDFGGGCD
jgi:hypothetical protein